jgi:hypothetical protein
MDFEGEGKSMGITDLEDDEWKRLRDPEVMPQRALTIVTLFLSAVFCALVFWAGWKEAAVYDRCGLKGIVTVGRSCDVVPSTPRLVAPETPPVGR